MKRTILCLLLSLLWTVNAYAVDHFWVGGGTNTNWNSSPVTNWALTSGGAGNATAPSAGDRVFFDANSGTGAAVWNTSISLTMLDCTGSRNLITHNGAITITLSAGNLVLPDGVGATYTPTAAAGVTFTATSGTQQIKTNGKTPGLLTFNGVGGTFQLQDNLSFFNATSSAVLTAGTFDAQTFTVTIPLFNGSGSGVRELKGSGLWTVGAQNAVGAIYTTGTTTNLTLTNFTSNITVTGTTANSRTFTVGTSTIQGTVTIGANTGRGSLTFGTAGSTSTFTNLIISAPNEITQVATAPIVISNAPTWTGTISNPIYYGSNGFDTTASISVASGTMTMTWFVLRGVAAAGGATFTATNSTDLGLNTGITITGPAAAGGGGCILGGWLLWRDMPEHINDNFPAWLEKAA